MFLKRVAIFAVIVTAFLLNAAAAKEQKVPEKYSNKELRNLVIKSLEKSKVDLESMQDYVFSEVEVFVNKMDVAKKNGKIKVDAHHFLPSFRKEYVWLVKDGFLLRSPTLINGAAVSQIQKAAAEEKWIKEERKSGDRRSILDYFYDFTINYNNSISKIPHKIEQRFIFNFREGDYYYTEEKVFEGRKVIEVQYLPEVPMPYQHDFTHRIVLLIIPEEHQIVKVAFGGGVDRGRSTILDFTNICSITMDKQAGNIWLPRKFSIVFFNNKTKGRFFYTREYHSFKKTNVNTNVTFGEAVE